MSATTTPPSPTILILGAGTFGTSTAYHLSLTHPNPSSITIIDPGTPSPLAASHDINKILRADYSSAFYCSLAYEALAAWSSWSELKNFYHRTGWIMFDEEGRELSAKIRSVFRERGNDPTVDVELEDIVSGDWKGGILRGTNVSGFEGAYWNEEAGWCEATGATRSLLEAAMGRGVRVVEGSVRRLVRVEGRGWEGVELEDGRKFEADQVVLATGAWTSALFSDVEDELEIPFEQRVEKQASAAGVLVAHYKMSSEEMGQLAEMPVVVYGGNGEVIPPPKENRLLKFTNANTFTNFVEKRSGHKISVPPDNQHVVPRNLDKEMADLMTDRVMPAFTKGKKVDHWRVCWDARTPTQDWLLCRHPDARVGEVYFATGGSFHSYKFLPNVGKYMANVLKGQSNGEAKDRAWQWKGAEIAGQRGAHEKTAPRRDMSDL